MPGPIYGPALKESFEMLGLIAAILWIALIAALSVKWDATGQPPVSTAKMPDGIHMDVHSPVQGKVRSAALLAIGDIQLVTSGSDVRFALLGGRFVGAGALLRFYILHCVAIPTILVILMSVHFWRIRKDGGISGPL